METAPPPQPRPSSFPQQHQALPPITSLTSELPPPEPSPGLLRHAQDLRDSGNWSITHSKHSSGISNTGGLQLQTILNAEDSPSRTSIADMPHSARTSLQPTLPTLTQGFEHNPRQSGDATSLLESRRSSVDSRMNAGMGHLQISPSSPYESQNVSRVSLVSNLQHQRGITGEQRTNGTGPLSPLGSRTGLRPHVPPRRAPVINPNPRSVSGMPDPTAAAPTKGYPWAFPDISKPDTDMRRESSSGDSVSDHGLSRTNSFATSMNSSIYTADSGIPTGQKRFDDDMPPTHHHSMQHRSISSIQAGDPGTPGAGNYSRTPELRISHKMAERKRRSEMKALFDELNTILPNSPGGKSSKWEVLTKSIEYIKSLKYTGEAMRRDIDHLRAENDLARRCDDENRLLRTELQTMWQHLQRVEPGNAHAFGQFTSQLEREHAQSQPGPAAHINPLPPIQQQSHWPQQPSAMQGVEYGQGTTFEGR